MLVVLEDFRVLRVPQVAPELKEQVDHRVFKVRGAQQALLGPRVLGVLKGFREHKEQLETKAHKVRQVQQDSKEHKVQQELRVPRVQSVLKGSKVLIIQA